MDYLNDKKEGIIDSLTAWINLKVIMLTTTTTTNQAQRSTYSLISLIFILRLGKSDLWR